MSHLPYSRNAAHMSLFELSVLSMVPDHEIQSQGLDPHTGTFVCAGTNVCMVVVCVCVCVVVHLFVCLYVCVG